MRWCQFPNDKLLAVDEHGYITTTVNPDFSFDDGLEAFLDALAEAAVGSTAGLEDISYTAIGDGAWRVTGCALPMEGELGEDLTTLTPGTEAFEAAFRTAFAGELDEIEIRHALDSLGTAYEGEAIIPLPSGRELRCPAYPAECDYVRIVLPSQGAPIELAYWISAEWRDAPAEVMGAILGATRACEVRQ
jgi:hypothetical protein